MAFLFHPPAYATNTDSFITGELTTDATRLLEKDHAAVKALFSQYEKAGDRAFSTKAGLVASMKAEIEAYAAIEEEIFYPMETRKESLLALASH